ncbi:hypothetical protein LTR91_009888 [Friedmanniomyces endolithicus]|uniref:SAP domain-containing protein n=1 Tax=Friedmanniomyces endolithicus TaxID=329885 RepID=A0AAN6KK60_9PEZI|nr:hypothetical protein LTR94_008061 [Friedmanniomyces endolithicus]KAK0794022.1 hypothetical protein LTR75_010949 [Friedmanniomyces endolithicus]KAK0801295.1 hypothetical protein LTR38_006867 [Friedmanniomyces endolithicus]KAK0804868.1 hypothetical protein LTR59_004206 [Friedmanniomyces endolithicus]KAK0847697.1 hypothetical protein LTS02_014377 [Friedmanniomyces endolithicus]
MAPKSPTSPKNAESPSVRKPTMTRKGLAKVITSKRAPRPKKEATTDFSALDDDYAAWTVPQLKDKCRFYGITIGGKKDELVSRLNKHDAKNGANATSDGDDEHDTGSVAENDRGHTPATSEGPSEPVLIPGAGKPLYRLADGSLTIYANAGGKPPPAPRKPKSSRAGGKKTPKNGFRASDEQAHAAADEVASQPEKLMATRHDIARADRYLTELDHIILDIGQDNAGDNGPFQAVVQTLYVARRAIMAITKAEVAHDEPAADGHAESEDLATNASEGDVSDEQHQGDESTASSSKRSLSEVHDGEHVGDDDEPSRKRSREVASVESEESEEE